MTRALTDVERPEPGAEPLRIAGEIACPESMSSLFRAVASLRHPIFLDSARDDAQLGRYSYLAGDPFEEIRSRNGRIEVHDSSNQWRSCASADPFQVLSERLARYSTNAI